MLQSALTGLSLACQIAGHVSAESQNAASNAVDVWFPDYDCVRGSRSGQPQAVAWAEWLAVLEDQSRQDGWVERSTKEIMVLGNPVGDVRAQAAEECPVGLLMSDLLHALLCYDQFASLRSPELDACYQHFGEKVRLGLNNLGLRVLMGSRWPVYAVLNSEVWGAELRDSLAVQEAALAGFPCAGIQNPILDWVRFRGLFDQTEWYQPAVDVAYGPELEKWWREAAYECTLGFAVANLVKSMLCAHTESICFHAHATMIGLTLEDTPLHIVAGSGWPIFRLLTHVSEAVRRHRFHLDFHAEELLPKSDILDFMEKQDRKLPWPEPRGTPSLAMQDVSNLLPVLRDAVNRRQGSLLRLLYTTMVYGSRFNPYLGRFISRARALGIGDVLVVFCLDEEAHSECKVASGHCVRGTPSIMNKFTLPLVLLGEDFDVMWLDLDVFLFQSPTQFLEDQVQAGDYELLVSGAFAVDCVCSGVVFYRAVARTRIWLTHVLSWMYEHPYEHDQKAFSAFLRAGERVAFDQELPVTPETTPHWDFLDPETQFVSARHVDVAGWTGDADRIVAFHLLHGDSDDAMASRQFAQRFSLGIGYTALLDLFFNQTDLPELYNSTVLPHNVSPALREALWWSRWPDPRPATPGRCNETVPMRY